MLNVLLLAPVWMQLLHLLTADLVWIAPILTGRERADPAGGRPRDRHRCGPLPPAGVVRISRAET